MTIDDFKVLGKHIQFGIAWLDLTKDNITEPTRDELKRVFRYMVVRTAKYRGMEEYKGVLEIVSHVAAIFEGCIIGKEHDCDNDHPERYDHGMAVFKAYKAETIRRHEIKLEQREAARNATP